MNSPEWPWVVEWVSATGNRCFQSFCCQQDAARFADRLPREAHAMVRSA